jgi:hypothetical protein
MGFFQEVGTGIRNSQTAFNNWGRGFFANNFAEGGLASYMFPMEGYKVQRGILGTKVAPGSRAYMQNLQAVIDRGGSNAEKAVQLMSKARGRGFGLLRGLRGAGGFGLGAALFVAVPAILEGSQGGPGAAMRGAMGGAGNAVGGWAGMKAGAVIGAAIGSYIPVVGTAIGALAGAVVGAFAGSALGQTVGESTFGFLDAIAAKGRRRRTSNWIGDMSAFRTQKAATMRQASLQMMNNGLMTARSALGSEGVMFHQ